MERSMHKIIFFSLFFLWLPFLRASTVDLARLPSNIQQELLSSPIGDSLNVSVYDFILDELIKRQNITKPELEAIERDEKAHLEKPNDIKPHIAGIFETSFSHILKTLCKGTEGCRFLELYQKDGLLIGIADPYEELPKGTEAFLGKDPLRELGMQQITHAEQTDYLITWAIYRHEIHPNHFVEELSFEVPSKTTGQLMGFLRFLKRINGK